MKFATTLLPFLLPALVASTSLTLFGDQSVLDDSDLAVPGKNPLVHCGETTGDILTIEQVDLSPNPPAPGATLTIEAVGIFNEEVEDGAYINLSVKYGLIRLINTRASLCDQLENVNKTCPIEKGKTTITKEVELPKEIPPGKYTVLADVYTKDDDKITCLTATVIFGGST